MKTYMKINKQMRINRNKNPSIYDIYCSYFDKDELDFEMFKLLKRKGMLGRLFRGQKIDLCYEDIHIQNCWWRYEIFKLTKQYAPCVLKTNNPYWVKVKRRDTR